MQQTEHRDTASVSHNIYNFKYLHDAISVLLTVGEAAAIAGLIAVVFVLLQAVP